MPRSIDIPIAGVLPEDPPFNSRSTRYNSPRNTPAIGMSIDLGIQGLEVAGHLLCQSVLVLRAALPVVVSRLGGQSHRRQPALPAAKPCSARPWTSWRHSG